MAQAIVVERYGGPEALQLREVEVGDPGPGQVRLRHTRIGVNFHDVYVRSGLYRTLELPGTPGIEAVGVVEACGAGVDRWRPGDRVAYVTDGYGVYASERLVDAALLLAVPASVSDEVVASVLLRGLTVSMLLSRVHPVAAGDTIVVQAAAGGVGQLLCRWASRLGAQVIGTVAHAEQAEVARAAGCHVVVDSRRDDLPARVRDANGGRGAAVVYDGVGRDTFDGSLAALDLCGHLVLFGQSSGPVDPVDVARLAARSTTLSRPVIFHFVRDAAVRARMAESVFEGLGTGALVVPKARVFELADAAESHRVIESTGATIPLLLAP